MTKVRRCDEGAQPDARRHGGCRNECRDRGKPGRIPGRPPREMVVGPGVSEAQLLRLLPAWPNLGPGSVRKDDDSEAHGRHATGARVVTWPYRRGGCYMVTTE